MPPWFVAVSAVSTTVSVVVVVVCLSGSSEKSAPFIFLDLNISGKASVAQSLREYVHGEVMSGDNAVYCEACKRKSSTRLRPCLTHLPQLLVLHLKRFDLDYNTFTTRKLNDRCTFPFQIDMHPFTKTALEAQESGGAPATIPTVITDTELGVSAGAGAGSGVVETGDGSAGAEERTAGDDEGAARQIGTSHRDEYDLVGVLVHAGT